MANETEVEIFLEHFGIKGMHWGVRKNRNSDGNSSDSGMSIKKKRALGVAAAATILTVGGGLSIMAARKRNLVKPITNNSGYAFRSVDSSGKVITQFGHDLDKILMRKLFG